LSSGTANGVAYLNGSKVLTTGSALTFSGSALAVTGSISSTGGFTSNTTITAQLDGSDSAGAGPGLNLFNTAFTRGWRTQLSASNNKVDYYFNGAAYVAATTIDTSGNLGLGVTPPSSSTTAGFFVSNADNIIGSATNGVTFGSNAYRNSGAWRYTTSSFASLYQQFNSAHSWFTAPSGTAGNAITFTQAMTLDASGNLGVGTTSPSTGKFGDASCAVLVQSSDPAYGTNIFSSNSNNTKFVGFWSGHSGADSAVGVKSGTALTFGAWAAINGAGGFSEWGRFDSSGNLGVGSSSPTAKLDIGGISTSQNGLRLTASSGGNALAAFTTDTQTGEIRIGGTVAAAGAYFPVFYANGSERARITTGGALIVPYIYNTTGAGAGTVVVGTDGNLFRSSSSQRYKKDIVDARYGLADVLKLRAVNYVGAGDADTDKLLGGLIAEEVDAAGLSEFVIYDDQNCPDALHYAQMVSLAFKAIQEQQALITQLTARITALEGA
jgi:hypothetical protein